MSQRLKDNLLSELNLRLKFILQNNYQSNKSKTCLSKQKWNSIKANHWKTNHDLCHVRQTVNTTWTQKNVTLNNPDEYILLTSCKTIKPLLCPKKLSKTQTPNSFMSVISVLHMSSNPSCSAISLKTKNEFSFIFFVKKVKNLLEV